MNLLQQIIDIIDLEVPTDSWNGPVPLSSEKKAEKIMKIIKEEKYNSFEEGWIDSQKWTFCPNTILKK